MGVIMARKMTHEEHIADIANVNPRVDILGEITGCNDKVSCRCRVCNHEWRTTPHSLKAGRGCPECKRTKIARIKQLSHNDHAAARLVVMCGRLRLTTLKMGAAARNARNAGFYPTNTENFTSWLMILKCQQ